MRLRATIVLASALTLGLASGCTSTGDEPPTTPPGQMTTGDAEQPTPPTADDSDEDATTPDDGDDPGTGAEDNSDSGATESDGDSTDIDPDDGGVVAALKAAGDAVSGKPYDMERETHGGETVWEIKVAVAGEEHELHVALDGSQIINKRKHAGPDDDVAKAERASVSAVKAWRTALKEQPGELDELEIDTENGVLTWEIKLRAADGSKTKVIVDAMSGKVIDVRAND